VVIPLSSGIKRTYCKIVTRTLATVLHGGLRLIESSNVHYLVDSEASKNDNGG